jgi:chromosome segregation ATPase
MLLTTGLFIELARFLQIILWIILPILVLSLATAILIHRYQKKNKLNAVNKDDQSLFTSMENPGRGAYVLFDHSGLVRKYRNKLSYNQARYIALKHDFEKLELKYAAMATFSSNIKSATMENPIIPVNQQEDFENEKSELIERLEQITRSYQALEEENESLLEQINLQTATDDEKTMVVNRWKEENAILRSKASEQDYLQDVLEEKKRQIDFLQQQLEQRIRAFHDSEQQQSILRNELIKKADSQQALQTEVDNLHTRIIQQDEKINEQQQELSSQYDQRIYLENVVKELRAQNELLNASMADSRDIAGALQEQLVYEQSRVTTAEQKLSKSKQLLHRMYKDLATSIEIETPGSPVISLRPGLSVGEGGELAG